MDQHIAAISEAQLPTSYYIQQHQAMISPTLTPTTSSNLLFQQQQQEQYLHNQITHQHVYNQQPLQYVAYNTSGMDPQQQQQQQQQQPSTNMLNNQQQQQQGPYQSIDFFYETPQLNNSNTNNNNNIPDNYNRNTENTNTTTTTNAANTNTNYHQAPPPPPASITSTSTSITRPTTEITTTTQSSNSVDEDYVLNLANELQHTKQLLSQYQIRTEQLMSLVEKQTAKINELREQLAELKK